MRIAGSRISASDSFPLPSFETVSTQAAAHPGTVTEFKSVGGILEGTINILSLSKVLPLIPLVFMYSRVSFSGERPEPLNALTSLVWASKNRQKASLQED